MGRYYSRTNKCPNQVVHLAAMIMPPGCGIQKHLVSKPTLIHTLITGQSTRPMSLITASIAVQWEMMIAAIKSLVVKIVHMTKITMISMSHETYDHCVLRKIARHYVAALKILFFAMSLRVPTAQYSCLLE